MKNLSIVLSLAMIFCLLNCNQPTTEVSKPVKEGVFVHISHGTDDLHRVLMGLQMAAIMAESKDVLVYFDINGVDIVLNDSEDYTYSHFPSSKTQIKKLLSKNATIMVCPGCLKAAGKTAEDVIEGIQIANKEKFFTFTKGRILTIDY